METPSSDRALRLLLLGRALAAVRLAAIILQRVKPSYGAFQGEWEGFERGEDLFRLDAYTVALLQYAGVSWQGIAMTRGVSKQALHRQFAQLTLELLQTSPELDQDWFGNSLSLEETLQIGITDIIKGLNTLRTSLDGKALAESEAEWLARRRRTHWYWNENSEPDT